MYLLKLEWLKFQRNLVVGLLIFSYMLFLPIKLISGKAVDFEIPGFTSEMLVQFPSIWAFVGYIGNWLSFFLFGFLALYVVTSEFANNTFRQNIICGLKRKEMFSSKVLVIISVSIFAAIYYGLVCLTIGLLNTEDIHLGATFDRFYMIPRYFLMSLGYMALGLFTALLIRRTAVSVFFYFIYVMFIEVVWRWGLHKYFFDNKSMHFYPANAFEDLVPIPFREWPIAEQFIKENKFPFFLEPMEAVTTSIVYIALFLLGSWLLIKRRDL